jgi:hypothetical protein
MALCGLDYYYGWKVMELGTVTIGCIWPNEGCGRLTGSSKTSPNYASPEQNKAHRRMHEPSY